MAKTNLREENRKLLEEYRACTDQRRRARLETQIIQLNLPFAKYKAKKFLSRSHVHIEADDAIQAATIGLLTAIRRDQGKSAFTTFAGWWVFHELQALAAKYQPIHRPKGAGVPYKIYRLQEAIKAATNVEATDDELQVKKGSVEEWRQSPVFFPLEDAKEDARTNDDRMASQDESAEDILIEGEQTTNLNKALASLSDVERDNLIRIYVDGKKGDEALAEECLDRLYGCLLSRA